MLPNGNLRRSTKVANWQLQLHICWKLPIGDFSRSLESCQMMTERDPWKSPIGDFSCTSVESRQLVTLADPLKVAKWQVQEMHESRQLATSAAHLLSVAHWRLRQCQMTTSAAVFGFYQLGTSAGPVKVAKWRLQEISTKQILKCCLLATFTLLFKSPIEIFYVFYFKYSCISNIQYICHFCVNTNKLTKETAQKFAMQ